jgi:circadian clock protein KaiC
MSKVAIRRLASGVPGLDEILGGGLPEFSLNVIAGASGCGKTTLAHQMMFALGRTGGPALYFTVLAEPPLKILRYQQQFDFFDTEQVGSSVQYVNLSEDIVEGDYERVIGRIALELRSHKPGVVMIDSFRALIGEGAATGQHRQQQFVQELAMLMTSCGATTFLVGESSEGAGGCPSLAAADGVIWLRQRVDGGALVREIEILKIRGQARLPSPHAFSIGSEGIRIFPSRRP